jgi:hypothetical protein
MLEHARKVDSTVEIKNKLMQCKSIFESIQNNNEKSNSQLMQSSLALSDHTLRLHNESIDTSVFYTGNRR